MIIERRGKSIDETTTQMIAKITKGVEIGVKAMETDAKLNVGVDTGTLRRSITSNVSKNGGSIVGQVGSNVDYAFFHHLQNPYLSNAVDSNLTLLINAIKGE